MIEIGGIYDCWGRSGSVFSLGAHEEKANRQLDGLVKEINAVRKAMGAYERRKTELDCQILFGDDQIRNNLNSHIPGAHYTDVLKKFAGQVISGMTAMAEAYGMEEEVCSMIAQVLEMIQANDPLVRKALLDTTNGGLSVANYLGLQRSSPTKHERPILEKVRKAVTYSPYTDGHMKTGPEDMKEHCKLIEGRLSLYREADKVMEQDYVIHSKKLRFKYHLARLEENYRDIPALQKVVTLSSPESGPTAGQPRKDWSPIVTSVQTVEGDVNIGAGPSGNSGARPRSKRSRNEANFSSESD